MKIYLGLSAVALSLFSAPSLFAQPLFGPKCGPTCNASVVGRACGNGRADCGMCGLKQSPLMEKRYIKQFCRPTIAPDSCFGYHKTQWTAWPQACPNWGTDLAHPGPYMFQRPAAAPQPAPEPTKERPTAPPPTLTPKEALPKPPTSPLPEPKEMKPTFPDPKPLKPEVPDALPKPPTIPPMPNDLPKLPGEAPKGSLPSVSNIPSIPVGDGSPTTRVPF